MAKLANSRRNSWQRQVHHRLNTMIGLMAANALPDDKLYHNFVQAGGVGAIRANIVQRKKENANKERSNS
jgi:hypothetical protein